LYNTFDKDGIEWYKKLFKYNDKLQFEKCANYIEKQSTMKRISEYIPDVKLIICVRNSVERAYSEFQMQIPNQKFTFKLAEKRGYLSRGKYYNQIKENVLPYFNKENIYIIIQERMKINTQKEMRKLYKFLGVSDVKFGIQVVTPEEATDRNLDLKTDRNIQAYKVWKSNYKPMNEKVRFELYKYFESHNERFFKFLGYKIEEWT